VEVGRSERAPGELDTSDQAGRSGPEDDVRSSNGTDAGSPDPCTLPAGRQSLISSAVRLDIAPARQGARSWTLDAWRRLGPPAGRADYERAHRVARELARQFAEKGARAVLLSGSWARRDARRSSDLDLWVLGKAGAPSFSWREPFLVSVSRISPAAERRKFLEPPHTGELLGAWRTAITLYDPHGDARRLRDEAHDFRWELVDRKCDRWVARSMVTWGEEAVKIVNSMARGESDTAAVQRNLLAESLVFVLAVHRRIVWVTDNGLWNRLGREEGSLWWSAQRRALALSGETLEQSARAALELYALTARRVRTVLRPAELATIERVVTISRREGTFRGNIHAPVD